MHKQAYTIIHPYRRETPVIFASPHSGRDYPAAFLDQTLLDARLIRSSEDAFVDQLFDAAPLYGAPLLVAQVPRAYLDLNRAPDELDPALIDGIARPPHNPRVSSGLGVIPRVVANGRPIYRGKLSLAEARHRIATVWHPYHNALRQLIDENQAQFGQAILIDCHSMPHEAIEAHARPGHVRPDVVLGDRFGAAAGREVIDCIESAFAAAAQAHPGRVAARIGYDEVLAHRLIAGSDAIMVPSRFEPCGLTQLYGLRYGTLPLVRRVGGLVDTVVDANADAVAEDRATGFGFDAASPAALEQAVQRAIDIYHQPPLWRQLMLRAMAQDYSWEGAARKYMALYAEATGTRPALRAAA